METIETVEEYQAALARIEQIMSIKSGTPEFEELERLADRINDYEDLHYPMDPPTQEALNEQLGTKDFCNDVKD